MKQAIKVFHAVLIAGSLLFGTLSLLVFGLPFGILKKIGDFLSRDHDYQRLTPSLVQHLKGPVLIIGILVLLLGILLWSKWTLAERWIEKCLGGLRRGVNRLLQDTHILIKDLWAGRPQTAEILLLGTIVVLAAVLRWALIKRAIEYDEAYTYVEFARHSFKQILIDYNVPNNHVFHTILVRLSTLAFGNGLWQIRLPTFLASLLLVIAMFFLARNYYGRLAGFIAAGLTAAIPSIVLRSVSARGYIIVTLMMATALLLADFVIKKKNSLAWTLLAFACALGLFTIPVMLYPAGFIFVWLLYLVISRQYGRDYPSLRNWLKYFFISGFLVILFTGLLYSPILLTGTLGKSYVDNRVLQPAPLGDFLTSAPGVIRELVTEWKSFVNPVLWWIGVLGVVLSVVAYRNDKKHRLPMLIVFIPYLLVLVFLQRPYPISRIWLWMFFLFILWSGAGIGGALQWAGEKLSCPVIGYGITSLVMLGLAVNGAFGIRTAVANQTYVEDPAAEPVASFLKGQLARDDLVVMSGCANARYWYYLSTMGIPDQVSRIRNRPFARVYVIAYTESNPGCGSETLDSVLQSNGPDAVFLDMAKIDLVYKCDYASVYEVGTYPERIREAFGGE